MNVLSTNFLCGRFWLFLALAGVLEFSALGSPRISEFCAANSTGLADEDGDLPDWIEIFNPDDTPVSLAGYRLTDKLGDSNKWTFPAVTLQPGGYLVVFASSKNRVDPARPLHTNFELSEVGEDVALFAPGATTPLNSISFPSQSENQSFGTEQTGDRVVWNYYQTPTPGGPNGAGTRLGPLVIPLERNPTPPSGGPLIVRAMLRDVNAPAASVTLYHRKMFAPEASVAMKDDGTGGDDAPGDGIWSATIPASAFAPGEMTRWRFVATDTQGAEAKEPPYRSTVDSPQYYGTVTQDGRIQTRLSVLHWFTSNANGAGTTTGSRGAIYYDGEFYDNVLFTVHGQSSSGFPKKSYNIDFNRNHHFRWSPTAPRVADIDLLSNWADKSKVRHVLAYEIMREAGVPAHFAYTVRVQQNGSFFSTADIVEDADETYLERAGLNPDGALYKVYQNTLNRDAGNTATQGVEKKTRKTENNSDLQGLINGLDLTGSALNNYLYDNIDIPRCVNMLAGNSVIRNIDMHSKNWYIYRDTGTSDEWAMLPWDLDLSHGRVWNEANTYFDNALYTDGFVVNGTAVRLAAHLFSNPSTRAMIMRRIRTLVDQFLQPPPAPGTPENTLYYERRLNEQSALIDPPEIVPSDARLDFEKWGSWLQGGQTVSHTNPNAAVETMAEAILRWKNEYLPRRRNFIYNTQIVGRGGEIPLPQVGGGPTTNFTALVASGAEAKALVPSNGNLGTTWRGGNEPFDTGGWLSGRTGVGYERSSGYQSLIGLNVDAQMRNNNSVYIRVEFDVTDPAAYTHLELRMKYDDGFVAYLNGQFLASANVPASPTWNSAAPASHEANPNAYNRFDVSDKRSALRTGRNVLAIHGMNDVLSSSDMLIVPELYGGKVVPPSNAQPTIQFGKIEANPASGNQDEEYIQLINPNGIAVDISAWQLRGAIDHTFVGGTVIPEGGSLYVSPSAAAFRARATSPKGGEGLFVQGGYNGHLSNSGQLIALVDPSGTTNNTATYEAEPSDTQRYLVVSELMYHPAGDGLAEFIELLNISTSKTLDLKNVRFTQGVDFDFANAAVTSLAPGARVLVVRDVAAFTALYGTNLPIAGSFANATALSNGGETIELEDGQNGTIREFTYGDIAPWPADVPGYSLALISPETAPDHNAPENWHPSTRAGGSPGGAESAGGFSGDPAADMNQNGEPDLIDYALGNESGRPLLTARILSQPSTSGGLATIQLIYPSNTAASDVELGVSFSTDLANWQDASASLETVSRETLPDGRELVTWRIKPPLREQSPVFLRLKAALSSKVVVD